MRLNGWQRIGITLSVLWISFAFYNAFENQQSVIRTANNQAISNQIEKDYKAKADAVCKPGLSAEGCVDAWTQEKDPKLMTDAELLGEAKRLGLLDKNGEIMEQVARRGLPIKYDWLIDGLYNSVTVPITWAIAYIVVWIYRWVKAGFQAAQKEP